MPEHGIQGPFEWSSKLLFLQESSSQDPSASITGQLLALVLSDATLSPLLGSCRALCVKFSPFLSAHIHIWIFLQDPAWMSPPPWSSPRCDLNFWNLPQSFALSERLSSCRAGELVIYKALHGTSLQQIMVGLHWMRSVFQGGFSESVLWWVLAISVHFLFYHCQLNLDNSTNIHTQFLIKATS